MPSLRPARGTRSPERAPRHQHRLVVVAVVDTEAGKGLRGRQREQFAGARHHRILHLGAMQFDGPAGQQRRRRAQQPVLRDRQQFGAGLAAPAGGACGIAALDQRLQLALSLMMRRRGVGDILEQLILLRARAGDVGRQPIEIDPLALLRSALSS